MYEPGDTIPWANHVQKRLKTDLYHRYACWHMPAYRWERRSATVPIR